MKKNIFLLLTIISLLLTSCSNLFEKSEQKFATISGNIIFETLLPERTIIPTYPALSSTDVQITVELLYAENDGLGAEPLTLTAGATSYTITLPYWTFTPSSYKVRATAKKGSVEILSGVSETFSIYLENQVVLKDIILYPVQTTGTKGGINLNITVDSDTGITNASVSVPGKLSVEGTKSDTTFTFQSSSDSTTANTYEATFAFKNNEDEILYSFTQLIYICSGVQTNTWVKNGDEPYLETTTTGGVTTTSCHITKELVDRYRLTDMYVKQGARATGTGSYLSPLPSIQAAVEKMNDKDTDYTIHVIGELTGSQTIPDTLTNTNSGSYHAKSVTICGYNGLDTEGKPQDSLDGKFSDDTPGTTLTISSSVQVTIKDLMITGGYQTASGGGGIKCSDANLILDSGSLVQGNYCNYSSAGGAGIYKTGGTLTIKNGSEISDNHDLGDNSTLGGGGIYNYSGNILMTGGTIKNNTAAKNGAGVYIKNNAVFEMSGGSISKNTSSRYGGGIYCQAEYAKVFLYGTAMVGDEATETAKADAGKHSNVAIGGGGIAMNNGSKLYLGYRPDADSNPVETSFIGGICYNYTNQMNTSYGGGAIFNPGSQRLNIKIHGGTIGYNRSRAYGGAIFAKLTTIEFDGGIIKSNAAEMPSDAKDSSIIYGNAIDLGESSYLTMGGSATITEDNDVYIHSSTLIKISSPLTPKGDVAAVISPYLSYNETTKVIDLATDSTTSLANEYKKFLISPKIESSSNRVSYIVTKTGFIKQAIGKKSRPTELYDIVFKDGSATAYSSALSLSDDEKAAAIAVIFYQGTDCSNDGRTFRRLGVGVAQSANGLPFTSGGLADQYIRPIRCWIPDAHRTPEAGWELDVTKEDRNGSDNLEQIKDFLLFQGKEDDTSDSSKYPLFYFAKNYESQTGSHVSGTDYADGWYIPSFYELAHIYWEPYDGSSCTVFKVNQALNKCGGTQLRVNETGNFAYGSSSRNDTRYHAVMEIGNMTCSFVEYRDSYSSYAIAIHEF